MAGKGGRRTTPDAKTSVLDRQRYAIRRRYKKNLDSQVKIMPGQMDFIRDMVMVLKLVNYSQRQIASIVGISRDQVSEILNDTRVSERLVHLQANVSKAALDLLESYLVEAVMVVVEIMRSSNDDAVRLRAAGEVFDRAGLPKSSRQERKHEEKLTFTDDGIVAAIRILPPEAQEQAAQMIEEFEKFLGEHAKHLGNDGDKDKET
jgi:transcriptional regulator with XRE-family HTH domain